MTLTLPVKPSDILRPVTRETVTLADLIRDERAYRELSLREAARRSGGRVSPSRLASLEHGDIPEDDRILVGIALALKVPVEDVRAAAGRSRSAPLPPFRLPKTAQRLTAKDRKAVLAVISALLAAHKERL